MEGLKVYIPNHRKDYDLSDAERFGELVMLTEGLVNVFDRRLVSDVFTQLADAGENDYIAMIGPPIINSLCAFYMARKFGRINVLQFNFDTKKYEPSTVTEAEVV